MSELVRSITYGEPVPQGSMAPIKSRTTGRVFLKASNEKALRPWRKAIARDALAAMGGVLPWDGALRVYLTFTLGRPMAATNREHHTVPPDVDKLARAALDALTGIILADDARVVDLQSRKRYVGHAEALPRPGVRITVERL